MSERRSSTISAVVERPDHLGDDDLANMLWHVSRPWMKRMQKQHLLSLTNVILFVCFVYLFTQVFIIISTTHWIGTFSSIILLVVISFAFLRSVEPFSFFMTLVLFSISTQSFCAIRSSSTLSGSLMSWLELFLSKTRQLKYRLFRVAFRNFQITYLEKNLFNVLLLLPVARFTENLTIVLRSASIGNKLSCFGDKYWRGTNT